MRGCYECPQCRGTGYIISNLTLLARFPPAPSVIPCPGSDCRVKREEHEKELRQIEAARALQAGNPSMPHTEEKSGPLRITPAELDPALGATAFRS